jgi:hypothetical protein
VNSARNLTEGHNFMSLFYLECYLAARNVRVSSIVLLLFASCVLFCSFAEFLLIFLLPFSAPVLFGNHLGGVLVLKMNSLRVPVIC